MWVCTPSSVRPRAHAAFSGAIAEIGLLHDRRGDHRRRLAVGGEPAVGQHDDAVGERAHHVHLVLDEQDGLGRVGLEPRDQVEHDRNLVDAHAGGRLVEHVRPSARAPSSSRPRACAGRRATARRRCASRLPPSPTDREHCFGAVDQVARAPATAGACRNARRRCACTASRTFSATLRRGKRLVSWNARPSPSRVALRRR